MLLRRLTSTLPLPPPPWPPRAQGSFRRRLSAIYRCSSEPPPTLNLRWMLPSPSAPIYAISLSRPSSSSSFYCSAPFDPVLGGSPQRFEDFGSSPSFYLVRDDLLHPLINGNKARKLDALVPLLRRHAVTDLVTCGGCQSAHAAAVAVCCAEMGMRAHLLLRGEQLKVPTGYNLISLMYGNVSYVARTEYSRREEMLIKHAELVAGDGGIVVWMDDILQEDFSPLNLEKGSVPLDGSRDSHLKDGNEMRSRKVVIVNEGADSLVGLLEKKTTLAFTQILCEVIKVLMTFGVIKDVLNLYACITDLGNTMNSISIVDEAFSQFAVHCLKRSTSINHRTYFEVILSTFECLCSIASKSLNQDILSLKGLIRLVKHLSQTHIFGTDQKIILVLDAGTGTTAIGLALGIIYLGLPWKVTAVMLADTKERYKERERNLISDFKKVYGLESLEDNEGMVEWIERPHPRRFGKVLDGEIDLCRQIAQQTGVLLDPVYTLAAWEQAVHFAYAEAGQKHVKVVMLHTGGTLGLFGLAQRYASDFTSAVPSDHAL